MLYTTHTHVHGEIFMTWYSVGDLCAGAEPRRQSMAVGPFVDCSWTRE